MMATLHRNRLMQGRLSLLPGGEEVLPPTVPAPITLECQILKVLLSCRRISPDAAIATAKSRYAEFGMCLSYRPDA